LTKFSTIINNENTEIEVIKLHDKINVYRGLLPNSSLAVKLLRKAEEDPESSALFHDWQKWGSFGKYIYLLGRGPEEGGPELTEKNKNSYQEEQIVNKEVYHAFYAATDHWLNDYGYKKEPEWHIHGPSYSRYIVPEAGQPQNKDNNLMIHHTDFIQLRAEEPGQKFLLTCTMYLNDDYDGGEIAFLVNNSGDSSAAIEEELIYKPKAGDVLVFPSGHPDYFSENGKYLHAVKGMSYGTKYLIRCFYVKQYSGSESWHANLLKYGAETWLAMEEERVAEGRKTHEDTKFKRSCAI
jgi:hypothetical protein